MPSKMLIMGETWIFNMEVQHDALEDRMIKIINVSGSMRNKPLISSKILRGLEGKTLNIFG
jgi:hypothetical protein